MSVTEAIPKISGLMIQLIELAKDGKTALLVQQIQSLNQTIQYAYVAAEQEAAESRTLIGYLKEQHAKEMADLNLRHAQEITALQQQVAELKAQVARAKETKIWPELKQGKLNHNF
jgi:Ni2+-binding GTPase involved in maturation of urease and hydrogenase